ncbi:MAG: ROK family protein, partial [Rhodoferax sp.]
LIAGNAIARRFGPQGFGDAASLLESAREGHAEALALVEELCRVMGRAIYNLVVTLDLQGVSMGGSVFWHHRDFLLPKVRAHVRGKLAALTDGVEIVPAGLGNAVGDYAALALVMRT